MTILTLTVDAGTNPTIVRISDTANFATITGAGYLASQADNIRAFNHGLFAFSDGDLCAITYSDGEGFFSYDATTDTFVNVAGQLSFPYQKFVSNADIIFTESGTWTETRFGAGNYGYRNTPAAGPVIVATDITEPLRTAAGRGFKLNSLDYIYSINNFDLDTHAIRLDRIAYTNNAPPTVTPIPLAGTPTFTQQVQPFVQPFTLVTPEWNNEEHSKYVIETTIDATSGAIYTYVGFVLHFEATFS